MNRRPGGALRQGGGLSPLLAGGLLLLVLLTALVALATRASWLAPQTPPPAPLEPLAIATNTAYAGTCPVLAAQAKGYFRQQGIVATVLSRSSGKAAMEAVLQGQANVATVADIPVMFAGLNEVPVAVIASIFRTERDHGVVGRRDRGVSDAASLKGKRIGVTLDTSGHFALNALINRQGLAPDEVKMRNYKPEELGPALARGEIDAAAGWEPMLGAMLAEQGGNGVAFNSADIYESLYMVAGLRDYVAGHPASMQRLLRALIDGARFCEQQPAAAQALLVSVARHDAELLKAGWPGYHFAVALDQGLLLALEDEARWAMKNELTPRSDMPNYLNYLYLDGLRAVAPAAVTVIH